MTTTPPTVVATSRSDQHAFSKQPQPGLLLIAGQGVQGDAHAGATVQHRSRVKQDPTQPNLRQVHLLHEELLQELQAQGFDVRPGTLGENITTRDLDLLALPFGALLYLGANRDAPVLQLTGLRNPCQQLDAYAPNLQRAVLAHDADGNLIRRAGVMAVVQRGGPVAPGDPIRVELPPIPHRRLERV